MMLPRTFLLGLLVALFAVLAPVEAKHKVKIHRKEKMGQELVKRADEEEETPASKGDEDDEISAKQKVLVKYAATERHTLAMPTKSYYTEQIPDRSMSCFTLILIAGLMIVPVALILFLVICLPGITMDYHATKSREEAAAEEAAAAAV